MLGRLEKNIQRSAVLWAESIGIVCIKLTTLGMYGKSGWPDYLLALKEGRSLFVEFKRSGEDLKPIQVYRHGLLKENGHEVETVDSVEGFKSIVNRRVGAAPIPKRRLRVPAI